MRGLLLQVEDFDISASVPVSYFYSRGKNTSELQAPIVIGVYLAKLQFVPKAILKTYVRNIQMLNVICCVPVCHVVVCSVSLADYAVVNVKL